MGCLKLSYYENEAPLKVVYGGKVDQQKSVQRFLSLDPVVNESLSPYVTFDDNPIAISDVDGNDPTDPDPCVAPTAGGETPGSMTATITGGGVTDDGGGGVTPPSGDGDYSSSHDPSNTTGSATPSTQANPTALNNITVQGTRSSGGTHSNSPARIDDVNAGTVKPTKGAGTLEKKQEHYDMLADFMRRHVTWQGWDWLRDHQDSHQIYGNPISGRQNIYGGNMIKTKCDIMGPEIRFGEFFPIEYGTDELLTNDDLKKGLELLNSADEVVRGIYEAYKEHKTEVKNPDANTTSTQAQNRDIQAPPGTPKSSSGVDSTIPSVEQAKEMWNNYYKSNNDRIRVRYKVDKHGDTSLSTQ
jgi:hypothetical protein